MRSTIFTALSVTATLALSVGIAGTDLHVRTTAANTADVVQTSGEAFITA